MQKSAKFGRNPHATQNDAQDVRNEGKPDAGYGRAKHSNGTNATNGMNSTDDSGNTNGTNSSKGSNGSGGTNGSDGSDNLGGTDDSNEQDV